MPEKLTGAQRRVPDRLWQYREEDSGAVARLANEIGATFLPQHEGRAFRVAWVKLLSATVDKHVFPTLYKYPDEIHAWAKQIEDTDGVTLALESALVRIHEEIHAIDYDDGWATDRAGSAMEAVCLSLLPRTRWMAEAGNSVWRFATGCRSYNDVVRISLRAWLCHMYAAAGRAALDANGGADG